jgi:hypothetical protein
MLNLDFEQGHEDVFIGVTANHPGREAQQPNGWTLSAVPVGGKLKSAGIFPEDDPPVLNEAKTLPEVRVLPRLQLPQKHWPEGSDPILLSGDWCFKVFSAYNPWSLTAKTVLSGEDTGAEAGDIVRIRVPVRTEFHPYNPPDGPMGDGSLGACRWRVTANDAGGVWHTYKLNIEDRVYSTYEVNAIAGEDGEVVLSIDLEDAAESGITYFVDNITYEVVPAQPPVLPPGECRGDPRVQYERTYLLLPPREKLTEAELSELLGRLVPEILRNGWTFGFSADDAGIGNLDVRNVIALSVHSDDWNKPNLATFYDTFYPEVALTFRDMFTLPHFPMATDTYPPAAWYVPTSQLFSAQHPAIDINLDIPPHGDVERGEPVTAVYSGEVHYVTDDWGGIGMCVVKHHVGGQDWWVRYAHQDVSGLGVGDRVDSGQILGHIDDWTGGDGGDHQHFGVHTKPFTREYRTGNEVDPVTWMKDVLGLDPVLVDAFIRKGDTPEEPQPPPQPPAPSEPEPYTLRSNNVLGLHMGEPGKHWDTYWQRSGANAHKVFSLGFGMEARRLVPDPNAIVVWRKYADHQVTSYDDPIKLLDMYSAEIETHCRHTGQSEAEVLAAITAVESLNEQVPTFNEPQIKRAVAFDVGFAELLHQRYGDALKPALLTVAIGNPHESEVELLLPAARAAEIYGGFLCYHGYWTANRDRNWLVDYWNIHAGRWMRWDDVFRANGVFPRYLLSEGGIVYAPDGLSFVSGKGWKACGDMSNYLSQMDVYVMMVNEWNRQHANRAAALTVFCYQNWGWDSFDLTEGGVYLMTQHSPAWL